MRVINKLAIASLVSLSLSSTAFSAQQPAVVAKLLQVNGKVFVESVDGKRQVAKKGMQITEGSHVMLLEKANLTMSYIRSNCRVIHKQNTLLTVQKTEQCGAGQPIAVGAAGAAAVPPKTLVAGKGMEAAVPPILKGLGGGSLMASGIPLAGLAGLGLLAYGISENDDDGGSNPSNISGSSLLSGYFIRDSSGNLVEVRVDSDGVLLGLDGQPLGDLATAGLVSSDGSPITTVYYDGAGTPAPVDSAGNPLDGDGDPILPADLADSGLTSDTDNDPDAGPVSG